MTPETTASLRQADRLERRSVRCAAHDPQQDGIGAKLMTCGLVALIALALTGCRVRSVNKASYVAKNEQVLRGIPVFRNAKLISDFSIGHTASDAPLGQENGPPFGSYTTWHQFQRQEAASCTTVGDWYRRVFRRLGWHRTPLASWASATSATTPSCTSIAATAALVASVSASAPTTTSVRARSVGGHPFDWASALPLT